MYRLLALLTVVRGIELVFVVLLLLPVISVPAAKLYIGLYTLAFIIVFLSSVSTYTMCERADVFSLVTAICLMTLDLYILAEMIYSGKLTTLLIYSSTVINLLTDLVLLLLSVELIRR